MASKPIVNARRVAVRLAAAAVALLAVLSTAVAVMVALGSPAAAVNHAVMIEQYAYSPGALTVAQGDTVTWTNHDSVQHDVTVTSGPATFHSPMLAQGQSWSHTFTLAGSYSYICSVHPDMKASVTVQPKATTAPKPATQAKPAKPTNPGSAPVALATTSTSPTAPARKPAEPSSAAAPAEAAAPAASEAISPPAAASAATLDPLLLVAGASTAVTVFCLLLMTSRPAVKAPQPEEP